MGAVNFSIDPHLVDALRNALRLDTFVETGTFRGDTVAAMASRFAEVRSIELSPELYSAALQRFSSTPNVRLAEGHSADALATWMDELRQRSVLYFLDAHWCNAQGVEAGISVCPLIGELRSISTLNGTSAIVIDDARLFMAPPSSSEEITEWPTLSEVVAALHATSTEHRLMIVNDVVVFYPAEAEAAIHAYAREQGTDWLAVMSKIRDYDNLRTQFDSVVTQLGDKEAVIHTLKQAYDALQSPGGNGNVIEVLVARIQEIERDNEKLRSMATPVPEARYRTIDDLIKNLEEKEAVIKELSGAVKAYRLAFTVFNYPSRIGKQMLVYTRRVNDRLKALFRPRLGSLCHHSPRPIKIPDNHLSPNQLTATPKVSIVTPSFGQGAFIGRTIDSVISQNYPNLEYFVQDGGSKDKTAEILSSYGEKLSGWESRPDNGQSHAINLGFTRTSGEIMAWLNSDDLLLPGAIATVVDYFNRHPQVDVIYGNRLLIDENDCDIGRWILPGHDSEVLSWADYVPQETLFWRRRIWDKVGGQIDEEFRFAMDWDLLVRFRDAGAVFAHIPKLLGAFRIHEKQKTSAAISEIGYREMDRIRRRTLGRIPSRGEIHKAIQPYLIRHITAAMRDKIKNFLVQ